MFKFHKVDFRRYYLQNQGYVYEKFKFHKVDFRPDPSDE